MCPSWKEEERREKREREREREEAEEILVREKGGRKSHALLDPVS